MRRALAASFVVTFAACEHPPPPQVVQTHNPPEPVTATALATATATAPATATATVALPLARDPKRVFKRADGTCWEDEPVECAPNEKCNPPPPRQVECPATPPVTQLPVAPDAKHVRRKPDGTCIYEPPGPNCPANKVCEGPPPSYTVQCPPK